MRQWFHNRRINQPDSRRVLVSTVNSCSAVGLLSGCTETQENQEQIAASHEFDGVRKEKERLTAANTESQDNEETCSGLTVDINRRKTRKKIINKTSYFLSNSLNKSLNQKCKLKISPRNIERKIRKLFYEKWIPFQQ